MSRVIQVTNIAPQATKEQMATLFGFLGKIEEIKLYPTDDAIMPMTSRVCYVKFVDATSVGVAQHLTNTVFIDRALIVVPLTDGVILDEDKAMAIAAPASAVAGLLPPTTPSLPANVINQVQGVGPSQVITTNDPRLTALGLPQYPPLPGNMDPSKIEEIRRTVYVGNLDSTITAEQMLNFFNQVGEVKFVRMAGDETQPTRFAFVEFTEQTSVAAALQYNGVMFGARPLKVNHSNNAIVKPQAKSNEMAQREIEEAMKRVREAQSLITAAIEPELVEKKRSRSPSRSRSRHRSHSRHRSRSRRRSRSRSRRSRSHRRSRSRSRKRSRTPSRRSRSRSHRSRSRSRDRKRKRKSRSPSLRKHSRSKSPKSSKSSSKSKDEKSSKSSKDKKESKEKVEISPEAKLELEKEELIKECVEKDRSPILSPKKKSRSPSISRHKSKSPPPRKKSRSPSRSRRTRSPPLRKSRSHSRLKSRSPPIRRKSRSPAYRRKGSRSPSRRKSRSPSRRKSRSPVRRKAGRSPSRRKSVSPFKRKSSRSPGRRKSSRSPSRRKSSRSPSRRKSRSPRKRSRSRSRRRSRSWNRSRSPKRRSRSHSRSKSPRHSSSKHKKDKKKERDRSRDRKRKHRDRESDKESDKASKITRDYDEEEKGYDSEKDMVVEGPALPPPPLPPPGLAPLPPLPPLPPDSNLQTVDMDVDSD